MIYVSLQVDPKTGLPPGEQSLDDCRERLKKLRSLAKEALNALQDATEKTRFSCHCPLPASCIESTDSDFEELNVLTAYQVEVEGVRRLIAKDEWEAAHDRIKAFLSEVESDSAIEAAFKLFRSLQVGQEAHKIRQLKIKPRSRLRMLQALDLSHPLLKTHLQYVQTLENKLDGPDRAHFSKMARSASLLCSIWNPDPDQDPLPSLLMVPAVRDKQRVARLKSALTNCKICRSDEEKPPSAARAKEWVSKLEEAAGPNRFALWALMGEVALVAKAALSESAPHNLTVAVLHQLLEPTEGGNSQHRDSATFRKNLKAALSAAALLACHEPYRLELANHLGVGSHSARLRSGETRAEIGAELETHFKNAGLSWGKPDDPESWACQWHQEWTAVTQMRLASPSKDSLPLGPGLLEIYGLDDSLRESLHKNSRLRRWYGPCAPGEALLWLGKHEEALEHLRRTVDMPPSEAETGLYYSSLEDPSQAVVQDAMRGCLDVRIAMLNQCRFTNRPSLQEIQRIEARMVKCCQDAFELLQRLEPGLEDCSRFSRKLAALFERMEKEVEKPDLYLSRKATVLDAQARKQCMDGVIRLWEEQAEQPRLDPEVRKELMKYLAFLRARRSGLIVDYVRLKFNDLARARFRKKGRSAEILHEMSTLADQAVEDAPFDASASLCKAQVDFVKAYSHSDSTVDESLVRNLESLLERAVARGWSADATLQVRELVDMARGAGDFARWMRRQREKYNSRNYP